MRRLEGPEVAAYDVLPYDIARRVRILRTPVLPNGADGATIGRWIFLKRDDDRSGNRTLIAHELVHVRQFSELGRVRFVWHYTRDYLRELRRHRHHRAAYLAIPAEIEARAEADAWRNRRRP